MFLFEDLRVDLLFFYYFSVCAGLAHFPASGESFHSLLLRRGGAVVLRFAAFFVCQRFGVAGGFLEGNGLGFFCRFAGAEEAHGEGAFRVILLGVFG